MTPKHIINTKRTGINPPLTIRPGCIIQAREARSMAKIVNSRCVLAVRNLEVSTRYYIWTSSDSERIRLTPKVGAS